MIPLSKYHSCFFIFQKTLSNPRGFGDCAGRDCSGSFGRIFRDTARLCDFRAFAGDCGRGDLAVKSCVLGADYG